MATIRLVAVAILLSGCVHTSLPEHSQFHSEDYPCPEGTVSVGDPRFPRHFTCERWDW